MPRGKSGNLIDLDFFKKKRILITGHTGFKGSWMCRALHLLGADIYGYSLDPPTTPNLYEISKINEIVHEKRGDVSNFDRLFEYFESVRPELVIHMAAQPLVRESYIRPMETYQSNVMGTVSIMECMRHTDCVDSFLNVTTDKVYENIGYDKYYIESDPLNGFDPYSNSKSCSELVTSSYKKSFFENKHTKISTARAGNVIGGGDYAKDRIIPDCVRAAINKEKIILRNPHSIRPYQHVLEPIVAYLTILTAQSKDPSKSGTYNVGPNKKDCVTTGELASLFCKFWGNDLTWAATNDNGPHEANFLKLDSSLIMERIGFKPQWSINEAVKYTVDWTKSWIDGQDVRNIMDEQIQRYLEGTS